MKKCLLATAALISFSGVSAHAASVQEAMDKDYLTPYIGAFNVLKNGESSKAQFGVEYRFHQWDWGVRPTVGANVDVDGGAYFYGGIHWDVPIGSSNWLISPNFMVGAYREGSSKDLGGTLQFRSGIEVAYQLPTMHRVGLTFNHISNASIYDKNPGAEALLLTYSIPMGPFFRY